MTHCSRWKSSLYYKKWRRQLLANDAEAAVYSAVASAFEALMDKTEDGEQHNTTSSVVLVAAAKHGSRKVVENMLGNASVQMPARMKAQAKNEAQINKYL